MSEALWTERDAHYIHGCARAKPEIVGNIISRVGFPHKDAAAAALFVVQYIVGAAFCKGQDKNRTRMHTRILKCCSTSTAVTYSTDVLQQLNSEFGIVEVVKYTSADAAADPDFYPKLVGQAMSMEADAILGCDFKVGRTLLGWASPSCCMCL
eukprot:scaffold307372_cov19-Tisochrysis_lutea.AAC.1